MLLFTQMETCRYLENTLELCPGRLEAAFIPLRAHGALKQIAAYKEGRAVFSETFTMKSHVTGPELILKEICHL
jgi:hypothetical protein